MKTKILWFQAVSCNGNVHSFLNYPYIERFLEDFTFVYHPVIEGEFTLEDIVKSYRKIDILLIDGTISRHFKRADKSVTDTISMYALNAKYIVTVGTCATFGGIFKENDSLQGSGFLFLEEKSVEKFSKFRKKVVSLSGCPVHPDVLVNTLYMLKENISLMLDKYKRPKEFFAYTVHNGCTRNEYFEYKIDNHRFGEKEGCMFYDHGCRAPFTHGSCNKILWNEVNSKTRAGQPCFGCTQPDFPGRDLFVTKKNMGIPQYMPFDVQKRAYLTLSGVAKAFKIERLEKRLFDD